MAACTANDMGINRQSVVNRLCLMLNRYELGDLTSVTYSTIAIVMQEVGVLAERWTRAM